MANAIRNDASPPRRALGYTLACIAAPVSRGSARRGNFCHFTGRIAVGFSISCHGRFLRERVSGPDARAEHSSAVDGFFAADSGPFRTFEFSTFNNQIFSYRELSDA